LALSYPKVLFLSGILRASRFHVKGKRLSRDIDGHKGGIGYQGKASIVKPPEEFYDEIADGEDKKHLLREGF